MSEQKKCFNTLLKGWDKLVNHDIPDSSEIYIVKKKRLILAFLNLHLKLWQSL